MTAERDSPRLFAGAAALAGLLLALHGTLLPTRSFFAGDQGVKYLQMRSVIEHGPLHPEVDYPARDLDPDLRFHDVFLVSRGGALLGVFPPLLPALTAPLFRCFGFPGLYLLPAAGVALTFLACRSLAAAALGTPDASFAALLAVLGTPVVFYGLEYWEHAPATALVALAAALLVRPHQGRARLRDDLLAGCLVGAAAGLRPEAGIALLAFAAALGASGSGRDLPRRVGALAAGFAAAAAPQAVFNLASSGSPLPLQWSFNAAQAAPRGPALAAMIEENLLPLHGRVLFGCLLLAAGALAALARRRGGAGERVALPTAHLIVACLLLLAVVVPAARIVFLHEGFGQAFGYRSAAHTWPLAFLLVYAALPAAGAAPPVRRFLPVAGIVFVVGAVLAAPTPGGFQWGARLLLPAAPLLAVAAIGAALGRSAEAGPRGRRTIRAAFLVVAAAAVCVQTAGVAFLARSKRLYGAITRATEAATPPGGVVATDLFWFPQVTATLYDERRFLLVHAAGDLETVAARAADRGFDRLAFVTNAEEGVVAPAERLGGGGGFALADRVGLPGRGLVLYDYRRDARPRAAAATPEAAR
jgi:hypothetical protein